ncbi:MAG: NAD(P)H-binding protein [Acetobacteraceae bacterium]
MHVIGASGRTGSALCRALQRDGAGFIPIVRNAARWAAAGIQEPARVADVTNAAALRTALADAACIVCCAHAHHADAVLQAAPIDARFVFIGSTRKFTQWPDAHGTGVIAGEATFLASGRAGVMLHPTMIYGATGEDNVQRLAALLRRLPIMPLPGGGRALVQPIHQDDVTRAIRAAIVSRWSGPEAMVIAGPEPLPYAAFVRAIAAAAGTREPLIVSLPVRPLMTVAPLVAWTGLLPAIRREEIRRLTEDKAFDITAMRTRLGVEPVPLAEGLARTFPPSHNRN